MLFSTLATLGFAGLAATQATGCPPRNPDGFAAGDELAQWAQQAVSDFFPYREGWEDAYDIYFSPDVHASFNATSFTFDTFKAAYQSFYPLLSDGFAGTFEHGFMSVVGVPNAADRGGFVVMTGWQGGFIGGDTSRLLNVTDAAYAVVVETEDCQRQWIEFRETSNLGQF